MAFVYQSGEVVISGDAITYHGEPGAVVFVIAEPTGDQTRDWYLEQFPQGGVMINAKGFGKVFLSGRDLDEDLKFISRRSHISAPYIDI